MKSKGNEKREGLYLIIMSILLEILIDSLLRVSSSSSFTLLITLMVVISFVDVTQFPDIKDLEFVLQAVNVCILGSQSSEEKKGTERFCWRENYSTVCPSIDPREQMDIQDMTDLCATNAKYKHPLRSV